MVFTSGYAACQVCSPSMASRKVPARHGITDWIGAKTGENWRQAERYSKFLPPDYAQWLRYIDWHIFHEMG